MGDGTERWGNSNQDRKQEEEEEEEQDPGEITRAAALLFSIETENPYQCETTPVVAVTPRRNNPFARPQPETQCTEPAETSEAHEPVFEESSSQVPFFPMNQESAFPWDVFPDPLAASLQDLALALAVQPEMLACMALGVSSAAIGNSVEYIEAKPDFRTKTALWMMVVARSGQAKTPSFKRLMKPVYDLQDQHHAAYQASVAVQANAGPSAAPATSAAPAQTPQSSQPGTAPAPALTSLYTTDATIEALVNLFNENKRGVLLYHDELALLIHSLNRYRQGKGGDREQYLQIWNTNPIKVDRSSKQTIYIPNCYLVVLGGIQPHKLHEIFDSKSFDDGMIPRFLFFHADNALRYMTDHAWSPTNSQLWDALIQSLYAIPLNNIQLVLSSSAKELFIKHSNDLRDLSWNARSELAVFYPKLEVYLLRLIGLLHVVTHVSMKEPVPCIVDDGMVVRAKKLVDFFLYQAKITIGLVSADDEDELETKYITIIGVFVELLDLNGDNVVGSSEAKVLYNNLVEQSKQVHDDRTFAAMVRETFKHYGIKPTKTKVQNSGTNQKVAARKFNNADITKMKALMLEQSSDSCV